MKSINRNIIWVFLCTFALLFQGCGSSTSGSGSSSTSAKDVTVSGSMSLSGTTSSSIVDHGVLSLAAASADDYKLYCVTFTEPATACTMTIKAGEFKQACANYGDKPFGCFALDAKEAVYPLVAQEGLGASGGAEIALTIEFDPVTGMGAIKAVKLKGTGAKKVEVTADSLADLIIWKGGKLYSMAIDKEDFLGLPGGTKKAQQGPGQQGPKPGDKMDIFVKLFGKDSKQLLIAQKDISSVCKYDDAKSQFKFNLSNGTKTAELDVDALKDLTKYEAWLKDVLNNVLSVDLRDRILKYINYRIGDRFSQCDELEGKNSPITITTAILAYVDPAFWQSGKSPDKLAVANLVKVSASTSSIKAPPRPDSPTEENYEPAVEVTKCFDKDNKQITCDGTEVYKYSHPERIALFFPSPFIKDSLQQMPIFLASATDTVTSLENAVTRVTTGAQAAKAKESRGCGSDAKGRVEREEVGRILHEVIETLSHEQESAGGVQAVADLSQQINKNFCAAISSSQETERVKKMAQMALDGYGKQGPIHKQAGFNPGFDKVGGEHEKFKNGGPPPPPPPSGGQQQPPPFASGPQFGPPPGGVPTASPTPPKLAQQGPGSGGPQGFDPGIIACIKGSEKDISKVTTISDDAINCIIQRFMPPGIGLLCSLSDAQKTELTGILDKSCYPRGIRVEHVCKNREVDADKIKTVSKIVELDAEAAKPSFGGGVECHPELVATNLSPANAHDVLTRDGSVPAPKFAFESYQGPFKRYFDNNGDGQPESCEESFGVRMDGKLPAADAKILKSSDTWKGRVAFNDKNTCNNRQAQTSDTQATDTSKLEGDANKSMSFTMTPK